MSDEKVWFEKDKEGKRTGKTIAVLFDGDQRFIGISHCSKKDQFSKKIGKTIAIGRAQHVQKNQDKESPDMFSVKMLEKDSTVQGIPQWMLEDRRKK